MFVKHNSDETAMKHYLGKKELLESTKDVHLYNIKAWFNLVWRKVLIAIINFTYFIQIVININAQISVLLKQGYWAHALIIQS